VLPVAVIIPLPVSDSFDTLSSDFGEVDSSLEGTTVEELKELIRPISLTNDVPQKDEEYLVTYCQSKIPVSTQFCVGYGEGKMAGITLNSFL
jgi:hypothetical protein